MRKIITISREFGSGGRELGKRLAEHLGLDYFDGEIVEELSKETNLDKDYLTGKLEKAVAHYPASVARSFSRIAGASNSAMLIAKQQKVIKALAQDKDCVIVGRGADSVLADMKPYKIFVYADMSSKIARCKSRMEGGEAASDKTVERQIKSVDKNRKALNDLYSSHVWGDKSGYNLCVNTTGMVIKDIIRSIAEIITQYFDSIQNGGNQ